MKLQVDNFHYAFPGQSPFLKDISMEINQGDFVIFAGFSGSGKTTLMKNLTLTNIPAGEFQGSICYDGVKREDFLKEKKKAAETIGYIAQDVESQLVTDVVWHELAFGLENTGVPSHEIRLRVAEEMSYFGISNLFHKHIHELSGGQKQLVCLASILILRPSLLLLDEPLAQLDPVACYQFVSILKRINHELGTTIILAEHNLSAVLPEASHLYLFDQGKIVWDEVPEAFVKRMPERYMELLPGYLQLMRQFKIENFPLHAQKCLELIQEQYTLPEHTLPDKNTKFSQHLKDKYHTLFPAKNTDGIELKEVYFQYSKEEPEVLKEVSLSIQKGALFGILGENGSGKSTLAKLIAQVLKPCSGKIKVPLPFTLVTQNTKNLFYKDTVREYLMDSGEDWLESDISTITELLQLESILDRHPYDCSGGEQQMIALAKADLLHSSVVILDEPTKGIDACWKQLVKQLFKKWKTEHRTVVLITHDIDFAAETAGQTAFLFNGEILVSGNPYEVLSKNTFYTTGINRLFHQNYLTVKDVIQYAIPKNK